LTTAANLRADASRAKALGGAVGGLPAFDSFTLRKFPIGSADWTIWPDRPQTWAEHAIGHPLELSPFTWDYLRASCDGKRLRIDPHYDKSTWDTFWVDAQGEVVVHSFGGLFRETLGRQPRLREGICEVLKALRGAVGDPGLADRLERIRVILAGIGSQGGPPSLLPGSQLRGVSRLFWAWKLGAKRSQPVRESR
jgi:hypothetical protein